MPGSELIASAFTIEGLLQCALRRRPLRVLEVGAGIGTLTYALCRFVRLLDEDARPELIVVEDNAFCLGQLRQNLAEYMDDFTLVTHARELPNPEVPYDLVCLDGRQIDWSRPPLLSPRAVIYVEGNIVDQREELDKVFARRPHARVQVKPLDRRKGYWLYQMEPTPRERVLFATRLLFERSGRAISHALARFVGRERLAHAYQWVDRFVHRLQS